MIKVYEKVFNVKVDSFSQHKNYPKLRKSADAAMKAHIGYGADAIAAGDFMDRIVKMPISYISDWMDGKNRLEWVDAKTGFNYDNETIGDALNRQRDLW